MIDLLGKPVIQSLKISIKEKREKLTNLGITPKLVIILYNTSLDDIAYKEALLKKCLKYDIVCDVFDCKTREEFIASLNKSNEDKNVDGIIVMGKRDSLTDIYLKSNIDEKKDVDGIGYLNMARLYSSEKTIIPCTAEAVLKLLDYYNVKLDGKKVTVIGRSNIIGKPLFMSLLNRGATVTVCHSHTVDLKYHCKEADVLCCAIGKPKFINSLYVNKDMTIIDVGINVDEDGKICGDVDYEDVFKKVKAITPVPGGVGIITNTILIEHVVDLAMNRIK